jgi:hypothetical protein
MIRILGAVLIGAGSLVISASALAQSGPFSGGSPAPTNAGAAMTLELLEQTLRQKGFQTQVSKLNNGDSLVVAVIERDGWKYTINFEFNTKSRIVIVWCPLTSVSQLSIQQATALLKFGADRWPFHITLQGNLLRFEACGFVPTQFTPQQLGQYVEVVMQTVRDSYPIWNPANYGGPSVAQE